MSTTTIKVDSVVRDRLLVLARKRGMTMGALLTEATERLEREAFFARAREQLERLRQRNPDVWETDRAEAHSWHTGTDSDTLSRDDEDGWWDSSRSRGLPAPVLASVEPASPGLKICAPSTPTAFSTFWATSAATNSRRSGRCCGISLTYEACEVGRDDRARRPIC